MRRRSLRQARTGRLIAAALFSLALAPAALWARQPTQVEDQTPREYWQFLFLYEQTRAPGQVERIFHPFYGVYSNEEKAYDYRRSLYPIFYSHGTYSWQKWTFLWIFTGDDVYREESAEDSDFLLGPFFQLGRGGRSGERYVSVFPFYGNLRNKLGYSEINYVLFPAYANWSYRDYKAHGVLWPLIMWGGSETRDDLRIFPFYSHKTHAGQYDRRAVLWPFFQWGSEGLDKQEPRHYFFSFPLYGRKWSDDGNLSVHSFLWLPLLGGFVAWGEDKVGNTFNFNALFFLYQYGTSDDPVIRRHVIFPFYGYYRFGNTDEDDKTYYNEGLFITPLYARLRTNSEVLESDYTFLLPFLTWNERFYKKERESDSFFKLWPLFQTLETSGGRREFRSLVLWPFRSDQFEKDWGTLYSLVEVNRYENGDRYFSTLWRIYSRYWNETEEHHFLIGLELHLTPRLFEVSFLGGFLGFRRDYPLNESAYSTLQFLWLDIFLGRDSIPTPLPAAVGGERIQRPVGAYTAPL